MEKPKGRGLMIIEFRGHGGITHYGNSQGKRGGGGEGVKRWKPSMVWYGYFLELPIRSWTTLTLLGDNL